MNQAKTTRRGILGRALLLAAGAAGAAGTGTAAALGAEPATIRLHMRQITMRGAEANRHAVLIDQHGRESGRLSGVRIPAISPFPEGPAMFELHTLTLPGGTLSAQGTVTTAGGTFHLVGGTGSLAALRGSYELQLDAAGRDVLVLTTTTSEEGRRWL